MKHFLGNKLVLCSLGFFMISVVLLSLIYFRNTFFMPLVLHFTGGVGDFLGVRSSLLFLVIGFASVCFLNYLISFKILKDKPELAKFINILVFILNIFFLVLSYQLFYINR